MAYVPWCIVITHKPDGFHGLAGVDDRLEDPEVIGPFVTKYLAKQHAAKHLDVRWLWTYVPITSQFA